METMAGFGLTESCLAVIGGGARVSCCARATGRDLTLIRSSTRVPVAGMLPRTLGQLLLFRRVT
jgi:hypothetical protein